MLTKPAESCNTYCVVFGLPEGSPERSVRGGPQHTTPAQVLSHLAPVEQCPQDRPLPAQPIERELHPRCLDLQGSPRLTDPFMVRAAGWIGYRFTDPDGTSEWYWRHSGCGCVVGSPFAGEPERCPLCAELETSARWEGQLIGRLGR